MLGKEGLMTTYDNTNRGALYRDDKKTEPEDRDYSGTINVDGTDYWLSAWIKTSKAGRKFMSLAVKPKNETKQSETKQSKPDFDTPYPFRRRGRHDSHV